MLAQSPDGWEAATQGALREASKTIRDIQSIYIKEFQAIVDNDQITNYRVNVKISFRVSDSQRP